MSLKIAIVALLTASAVFVSPGVATADEPALRNDLVPLCTDISFRGISGQINLRTSPNRFVAWNIVMYSSRLNDGPWIVNVYVNNRKVDGKAQNYQPHGSINPKDLPPSSFVSIEAWHTDVSGEDHYFVPNQCYVP